MGRAFVNRFSWSNSRAKLFSRCLRAYWWRYYGHWGGWSYSADVDARVAYRLGKMDSLATWAGSIVHDTIQEAIEELRDRGTAINADHLQGRAREKLRQGWVESKSGAWIRRPKHAINLREHYFGDGEALSRPATDTTAAKVYGCLLRFSTGPYPKLLKRLRPEDFRNVERLDSMEIDGSTVYVKPDLAFYHPDDGLLWLIDWKTGRPRLEDDLQLATYALFAKAKWGVEPSRVRGVLSYLASGEERQVELSTDALHAARESIRASMQAMKTALREPDENMGLQQDFPQTDDKSRCSSCNFRQLCTGSEGIPGAILAGDPL